jgi:heme exporter protein D
MTVTHAFYVYSSYVFAALVTVAVTLRTWADGRARRKDMATLEASGIRRRSSSAKEGQ